MITLLATLALLVEPAHWETPPDVKRSDYPALARDLRINGNVTLECVNNEDGALSRCAAMSAKPADAGFQQAALAIVFRGRVAQPAGVPFSIELPFDILTKTTNRCANRGRAPNQAQNIFRPPRPLPTASMAAAALRPNARSGIGRSTRCRPKRRRFCAAGWTNYIPTLKLRKPGTPQGSLASLRCTALTICRRGNRSAGTLGTLRSPGPARKTRLRSETKCAAATARRSTAFRA